MCMNCTVMCVSICVRDAMGAVLSWFAARLFALALDTADAFKLWRVSKTSFFCVGPLLLRPCSEDFN